MDLRGKGMMLESLVLTAHYLQIKENIVIRAIRHQLEQILRNAANETEVRRILDIKPDFDLDMQRKIAKEDNFRADKSFSEFTDMYESMVDMSGLKHTPPTKSGPDIVMDVYARKLLKAIKDASVNRCHKCDIEFGYIVRRHHCRECGYIFCNTCAGQRIDSASIPNPKYMSTTDYFTQTLRVCTDCHITKTQQRSFGSLIVALELMALKFPLLRRFSAVCSLWRRAAVSYLSSVREIQYDFPTHIPTQVQKDALWRNRHYFAGHSKWMTKLLLSIDWRRLPEHKVNKVMAIAESDSHMMNCYYLMCSSSCEKKIPIKDVFPLLDESITNIKVRDYAVSILSEIKVEDLVYYLPQLVYFLRYEPLDYDESKLTQFLFKQALESSTIAHFFLWEIRNCQEDLDVSSRYEILKTNFLNILPCQGKSYIYGFELLSYLQQMPPSKDDPMFGEQLKKITNLLAKRDKGIFVRYPTNPVYILKSIDPSLVSIKVSATKPIKLTFLCEHSVTGEEVNMDIIFKKDDVRKDRTILNIISLMINILDKNIDSYLDIRARKWRETYDAMMGAIKVKNHSMAFAILRGSDDLHKMMKTSDNKQLAALVDCMSEEALRTVIGGLNPGSIRQMESAFNTRVEHSTDTQKHQIHAILKSVVTYTVLPAGSKYGFIEVVPAETLWEIYDRFKNCDPSRRINEYIKSHNVDQAHSVAVNNFMHSLAAWVVITHLLGVGDRHKNNVMITKNGKFFHIDYGFVLGMEPKPVSNYVRYSQDFLAIIDQGHSTDDFKSICSLMFGVLRREAPLFLYNLMFLNKLDPSASFSRKYIHDEVANRFYPGLSNKDSEKYFENLLDSNKDSISQRLSDFTHDLNKITPQITQSVTSVVSTSLTNTWSFVRNISTYWNPQAQNYHQNYDENNEGSGM
eukprot:gene15620-18560_t